MFFFQRRSKAEVKIWNNYDVFLPPWLKKNMTKSLSCVGIFFYSKFFLIVTKKVVLKKSFKNPALKKVPQSLTNFPRLFGRLFVRLFFVFS